MSFNVAPPAVEVPLEVFGGLVTEMSPPDCPEGVSPDCQDVAFVPGSVFTRPGLQRVFTGARNTSTFTYQKSFVLPNGTVQNLYLASDGTLLVELAPFTSPGVLTVLFNAPPGSYAKSCTAFGREYIAISNTLNGATIPLQWDGQFLDRVTQNGPASPPQVTSFAYPAAPLVAGSGGGTSATPANATISANSNTIGVPGTATQLFTWPGGGMADRILLNIDGSITGGFPEGSQIQVLYSDDSGATFTAYATFTNSFVPQNIPLPGGNLANIQVQVTVTAVFGGGDATVVTADVNSLVANPASTFTLQRLQNVVSGETTVPHNLQVGYLAQIAGLMASIVGTSIASIVVNNEDNPGLATVTTSTPHGLLPDNIVNLNGVVNTAVGGAIISIVTKSQISEVTTTIPHGLSVGSEVLIQSTGGPFIPFNVTSVPSPTTFTYNEVKPDATLTGGVTLLIWPLSSADPAENFFTVQESPSPTTFTVALSYPNGTWTGGTVTFAWDGLFFITEVPSPTTFTYQQYGPDVTTQEAAGTVTPSGQAAPGLHQMRMSYRYRSGAISAPSPPVNFVANGGQYLQISDMAIGPSNVVGRILQFTGAAGAYFFYIPVPAQVNGQIVSTATEIDDNTTTAIVLDFSDNTLFAALGTSIPGNDLAAQVVLDGSLSFGYYNSRLMTIGQRNTVLNLLNMGFDGGALPSSPTVPTGWTNTGVLNALGGALAPGITGISGAIGSGWGMTLSAMGAAGALQQSAYQNYAGAPILSGNTLYRMRVWLKVGTVGPTFNVTLSSAQTAFSIFASITPTQTVGKFYEAVFSAKTPLTIPADMMLTISGFSNTLHTTMVADEGNLIFDANPYLNGIGYGSYVNNAEGFDGVTGQWGPQTDTRKLMAFSVLRQTFYMLTQEPSGRLHEMVDNGTTEPIGWTVNEVGASCGALSAFGTTQSQADDSSASGGEEWIAWASSSGARIFGGGEPDKISQEIEPDWESINPAANNTICALNDPVARTMYFGLPTGTATAPNLVYPMNYREMDSAAMIASMAPYRVSFTGKLIATDNARKWTRWNTPVNAMALMYRAPGVLTTTFAGGNGQTPGAAPGFGQVYTLNPAKLHDDDYGQIFSYYTTYFFVSREQEQQLQLGAHRKQMQYVTGYMNGTGNVTLTILCNTLTNPWPITVTRLMYADALVDLEWSGAYAQAQRMAVKISATPLDTMVSLDAAMNVQRLMCCMKPSAKMPVRGALQ